MPKHEPYGLGPALNQCCGGSVVLRFELLTPPGPDWLHTLAESRGKGKSAVLAIPAYTPDAPPLVLTSTNDLEQLPDAIKDTAERLLDEPSRRGIETVAAEDGEWWLEWIGDCKSELMLFGAGHVGKAVVRTLAELPFEVRWLDGREDAFPEHIPENATAVHTDDLVAEVSRAGPEAIYVVMTHSHDLDEDICHAVLERGDFAYLGLIGSVSKRRRFVHRLAKRGIDEQTLDRLICPIGLPGIAGKEPANIALSLAAQLMSEHQES